MGKNENISCYITAGGKAKRINGRIKAFIEISGERIIDRNLKIFRELFSEIGIITNSPKNFHEFKKSDIIIISDIYTDIGPLAGIHAALQNTKCKYVFIVASDMPFIQEKYIKLLSNAVALKEYDAVVMRHNDRIEPLFALYNTRILKKLELFIKDGESYALRNFLKIISTHYINISNQNIFYNVNYEEDILKTK